MDESTKYNFFRKSIEVVKPLAIEAGQTSKALLIVTARRLRTKGGHRALYAAHLIKLQSIAFVRKPKEQQTTKSSENIVRDRSAQNYHTGTTLSHWHHIIESFS
jgi:hypothetical protein